MKNRIHTMELVLHTLGGLSERIDSLVPFAKVAFEAKGGHLPEDADDAASLVADAYPVVSLLQWAVDYPEHRDQLLAEFFVPAETAAAISARVERLMVEVEGLLEARYAAQRAGTADPTVPSVRGNDERD